MATAYGQLLLVKIALFAALVALATVNREVLTPRLSATPRGAKQRASELALRGLRRNSLIEAGLGLGVLSIVAVLGTMVPAAHQQPLWPFPIRFNADVLTAPEFRGEVWLALASAALGLGLACASFVFRKLWGAVAVVWLVIIAFFLPSLSLLTLPAYPTSFFQSPAGYTTRSIALGQKAFAQNCASCHGAEGQGDGPLAKQLPNPPADLTAGHIYAHSDGDLFWWISHGIADTPMPGFAGRMDEATIWNLIDFIHANADGVRAARGTPAQAPDFAIQCPEGTITDLRQLDGTVVHLVFAGQQAGARLAALSRLDLGGDVMTVIVPLGAPAAATSIFCTSAESGMAEAYALYPPGRGQDLAGDEFLIDAKGWLRGMWLPRAGAGWSDDRDSETGAGRNPRQSHSGLAAGDWPRASLGRSRRAMKSAETPDRRRRDQPQDDDQQSGEAEHFRVAECLRNRRAKDRADALTQEKGGGEQRQRRAARPGRQLGGAQLEGVVHDVEAEAADEEQPGNDHPIERRGRNQVDHPRHHAAQPQHAQRAQARDHYPRRRAIGDAAQRETRQHQARRHRAAAAGAMQRQHRRDETEISRRTEFLPRPPAPKTNSASGSVNTGR